MVPSRTHPPAVGFSQPKTKHPAEAGCFVLGLFKRLCNRAQGRGG